MDDSPRTSTPAGIAGAENIPESTGQKNAPAASASAPVSSRNVFLGFPLLLLSFIGLLLVLRVLFLVSNLSFLKDASASSIFLAVARGLRFDAAAAGYLLIPGLLFYGLAATWRPVLFGRILRGYLAIASLTVLACVMGDIQYFEESGKHLTYEALAYLNLTGLPVFKGAFMLHPWITAGSFLATGAAGWGAWWAFGVLLRRTMPRERAARIRAACLLPLWIAAICVICRGGLQSRPITIGDSCVSNNPYLNAVCLSPLYSALYTVITGEREHFHYADDASNIKTVRALLGIPADGGMAERAPLLRTSPGTPAGNRKNVVIFILESWSGKDLGALGGSAQNTPVFDGLAKEGLLFDNFQATGIRTGEGMVSIFCAFPNLPGLPVLKRTTAFQTRWRSLSQILSAAGYTNIFIHGRNLDFDNVTDFLRLLHFDKIIDRRNFPPSVSAVNGAWPGYNDMDVMRRADEVFTAQAGRPFLGAIYLMNSHPPFMTPEDFPKILPPTSTTNKFLNSLHYTDASLGTFFDLARRRPWFKDTVFLFVADHARTGDKFSIAGKHHIPLLIYSPGYIAPHVCHTVGSQSDILPTVLGLLNLAAPHTSWGRDLRAIPEDQGPDQGFAVCVEGNEIRFRERHNLWCDSLSSLPPMCFNLDRDPNCETDLWSKTPEVRKLYSPLRAYLSLSLTLFYENRVAP